LGAARCLQWCAQADLEAKLREADAAGARLKLIATDGAFSMDGEIAPLDKIVELAEKYNGTARGPTDHAHDAAARPTGVRRSPLWLAPRGVHAAITFVDECHATGFLGKTGRCGPRCGPRAGWGPALTRAVVGARGKVGAAAARTSTTTCGAGSTSSTRR